MNKMESDLICVAPVSAQRVLILLILVRLAVKRRLHPLLQRQERAKQKGLVSTSSLVMTRGTISDKKC